MRFMIFRKADAQTEAGMMPTTELLEAMGNYMEQMAKAGILLGGEGLKPSSKSARVKFTDGKPTVIDGPFAETKELVAGYCLIQVNSLQEAIDWMKRWPTVGPEANAELEIRPLFEAEDFGPEFTPDQREREERLREEIGGRK
jgi:hypothetical protein